MNIAPPSGGDTHLEMALRVANQIVKQKVHMYINIYAPPNITPSN